MIRRPAPAFHGDMCSDEALTPMLAVSSTSPGTMGCMRMQFATTTNDGSAADGGTRKKRNPLLAPTGGQQDEAEVSSGEVSAPPSESPRDPGFAPLASQKAMSNSHITGSSGSSGSTIHFEDPNYKNCKKSTMTVNNGSTNKSTDNRDTKSDSSGSNHHQGSSNSSGQNTSTSAQASTGSAQRSPCPSSGSSSSSSSGSDQNEGGSSP